MSESNYIAYGQLPENTMHALHNLMYHSLYLLIIPALLSVTIQKLLMTNFNIQTTFIIVSLVTTNIYFITMINSSKNVYLVDFACYNPDPRYLRSRETIYAEASRRISPESVAFFKRLTERSGVGENTYLYGNDERNVLPETNPFDCGRKETEIVICGAIDDLLAKTRLDCRHIGVVIVNISMFNPAPSLSAMIVNRYKLREDVLTYSLGGMGCSASVIAIDLAKRLLQVSRDTYALVMSVECCSPNCYLGNDRSKLLTNCLFRMGGAAILLSNRKSDRAHSKYEIKQTVRTHKGADDRAYNCIMQDEDKDGKLGVTLTKDISAVAGEALKSNIKMLGPLVLPLSQQLFYISSIIANKIFKSEGKGLYVPDFTQAFEHFCIHTGGKTVLDAMENNLKLSKWHMEPSRMTLHRFGNTSSGSLWYGLAYAEAKGRIFEGDRVWQIAFGSGFKCNSAILIALRRVDPAEENSPWTDVIDKYPVEV